MWKPGCWKLFILHLSIVAFIASARKHGNPANEIVDFINGNRSASKLPKLYNSPGLGCMALQYISECSGNCSSNNALSCQPPEADITEVYAPNCGVELPTVSIISGRLVGCQWKYLSPEEAFANILVKDKKALSLVHRKEDTEVGVGFSRARHGPYIWGILLSNAKTNSTFVLEGGRGIKQKAGCFSGPDLPCSAGAKIMLLEESAFAVIAPLFLAFIWVV